MAIISKIVLKFNVNISLHINLNAEYHIKV